MAILLSTFNGERWLPEQLASIQNQSHSNWVLYWRDDGSSDGSHGLLQRFSGPSVAVSSDRRLGASGSFLTLLRAALEGPASYFAFADQDDVWLPDKLSRAVDALSDLASGRPGLFFCARTLVDASLRPIGHVPAPDPVPAFPASLAQNLAPGCCMMLNRTAATLLDRLPVPEGAWHDWWAYVVVSAHQGAVIAGPHPDILYRQHGTNLVGEPLGFWRRTLAAAQRGRGPFMTLFWRQVDALMTEPSGLPARSRACLEQLQAARARGFLSRLRALRIPSLSRQTWAETALFRLWFLLDHAGGGQNDSKNLTAPG